MFVSYNYDLYESWQDACAGEERELLRLSHPPQRQAAGVPGVPIQGPCKRGRVALSSLHKPGPTESQHYV